jgi:hypothetical protein
MSLPLSGKKEAPRDTSEKRAVKPPKSYPPVPEGKVVIFRPYIRDPRTGKLIYPKNGRVFRLVVDKEEVGTFGSK